jgi:hypothetical protein
MTHHGKSPDALDVKNLKLKPGIASTANGVFMKDGWLMKDGVKVAQSMSFTNAAGKKDQRGARDILPEREKSKKPGTVHDLNMQCYPCKKRFLEKKILRILIIQEVILVVRVMCYLRSQIL